MSKKIKLSLGNPEDFADAYQEKYLKMISKNTEALSKNATKNIIAIINKIYEDGFNDGYNEKECEDERDDIRQGRVDV